MSEEGYRLHILAKSDPKSFWKHIKTHNKSKTVNPTNVSLDEIFTHFNNLYGEQTANEQTLPNNDNDIYIHDIDLDQEFTEMEVNTAIMSQTNGKSN